MTRRDVRFDAETQTGLRMNNKKTTIAGFLTLGGAILSVVASVLTGGDIGAAVMNFLLPALAGVGLIGASDGSL